MTIRTFETLYAFILAALCLVAWWIFGDSSIAFQPDVMERYHQVAVPVAIFASLYAFYALATVWKLVQDVRPRSRLHWLIQAGAFPYVYHQIVVTFVVWLAFFGVLEYAGRFMYSNAHNLDTLFVVCLYLFATGCFKTLQSRGFLAAIRKLSRQNF